MEKGKAEKPKEKTSKITYIIIGIIFVADIILGAYVLNKKECPENYTLEGNSCLRVLKLYPKVEEYCDYGYTIENNKCVSRNTYIPIKQYYCDFTMQAGVNYEVTNSILMGTTCYYEIRQKVGIGKSMSVCTPDFTYIIDSCVKKMNYPAHYRIPSCSYGYNLINEICVKEEYKEVKYHKECQRDFNLIDGMCEKKIYTKPVKKFG